MLRTQTRDALDRADHNPGRRSDDWTEFTPVINVNVGREANSDPPVASGGLAVGKHGVKIGRLPPIAVVVIAVAAIIGAVVGYVLTH